MIHHTNNTQFLRPASFLSIDCYVYVTVGNFKSVQA